MAGAVRGAGYNLFIVVAGQGAPRRAGKGIDMATVRSVFFYPVWSVLASVAGLVGRGVRRGLVAMRDYLLIAGSYPSLTRDPGIAAFKLLTEREVPRDRPFRAGRPALPAARERLLHSGAGL